MSIAPAGPRVAVAGAGGTIGRHVVARLAARGTPVRALTRDAAALARAGSPAAELVSCDLTRPATLRGALDGCTALVACAGASLALAPGGRASYRTVDEAGTLALLAEAERAGVARMAYVSVFHTDATRDTPYVRAHEVAARAVLASTRLAGAVVRPTGCFSAFLPILDAAGRGVAAVVGDGRARTNPIDERDVAAVLVEVLDGLERGDGAREVACGGPDVLSRRQVTELACAAHHRAARVREVPPGVLRAASGTVRLAHPRLGDLLAFATLVSLHEMVAPVRGTRRLAAYFHERVHGPRPAR